MYKLYRHTWESYESILKKYLISIFGEDPTSVYKLYKKKIDRKVYLSSKKAKSSQANLCRANKIQLTRASQANLSRANQIQLTKPSKAIHNH